jgi:hypothetical protein
MNDIIRALVGILGITEDHADSAARPSQKGSQSINQLLQLADLIFRTIDFGAGTILWSDLAYHVLETQFSNTL